MNEDLDRFAKELDLDSPANEHLRLAFGYACASRVKQFLEDLPVVECLSGLGQYLDGAIDRDHFDQLVAQAARLANQHQGSKSIDGCGHAAVSATYAVANALAGNALQAADYAAYAVVYAQGGYGAVADRESFDPEFSWQTTCLAALVHRQASGRLRGPTRCSKGTPQ